MNELRGIAVIGVAIGVACSGPAATSATSSSVPPTASASPTARYSAYSVIETTTQPPGSILITMSNYAFTPSTISLPAGRVVLFLVNPSNEVHNVTLREPARPSFTNIVAVSDKIEPGKSEVLTIESLPAGVYQAICTVQDHAARGMVADLTAR